MGLRAAALLALLSTPAWAGPCPEDRAACVQSGNWRVAVGPAVASAPRCPDCVQGLGPEHGRVGQGTSRVGSPRPAARPGGVRSADAHIVRVHSAGVGDSDWLLVIDNWHRRTGAVRFRGEAVEPDLARRLAIVPVSGTLRPPPPAFGAP